MSYKFTSNGFDNEVERLLSKVNKTLVAFVLYVDNNKSTWPSGESLSADRIAGLLIWYSMSLEKIKSRKEKTITAIDVDFLKALSKLIEEISDCILCEVIS